MRITALSLGAILLCIALMLIITFRRRGRITGARNTLLILLMLIILGRLAWYWWTVLT
jgi:hypothetical protein